MSARHPKPLDRGARRRRRTGRRHDTRGIAACIAVGLAATLLPSGGAYPAPVTTVADVQREVARLRAEAEQSTERYNELGERLRGTQVLLQAAQDRVVQQRIAIASTRRMLGRWGAEAYRQGALATVAVALGDDPEALLAHSGLVASLSDQKQGLLLRLRGQEADLERAADAVRQWAHELDELLRAQAAARAEILDRLDKATALLNSLKESQRRALERADRDHARAEALRQARAGASADDRKAPEPRRHDVPRPRRHDTDRPSGDDEPRGADPDCGSVAVEGASARAAQAIAFACAQLGEPYRWGADGPSSWDCSGLTMRAWARAGVRLPHSSKMQYGYGQHVSRDRLRPGDLVFFYRPISHVGLYLGNGLMIHAPHTGDVVRIAPLHDGLVGGVRL